MFAAILAFGANLRAITSPTTQALSVSVASENELQPVAFSDSAEAGMLHRAYHILAMGDHDYKGHRVRAMRQIEAAVKMLGLVFPVISRTRSLSLCPTTSCAKPVG